MTVILLWKFTMHEYPVGGTVPFLNGRLLSVTCSAGCFFSNEVTVQSQGSVPCDMDMEPEGASGGNPDPQEQADASKRRIPKVTSDSFISELVSDREGQPEKHEGTAVAPIPEEEAETEQEVKVAPAVVLSHSPSGRPDHAWSNVDLEEAQGRLAVGRPASDTGDSCSLSSVATYNLDEPYGADDHPIWAWVNGGSCAVDSHSQLNWFNSGQHHAGLSKPSYVYKRQCTAHYIGTLWYFRSELSLVICF